MGNETEYARAEGAMTVAEIHLEEAIQDWKRNLANLLEQTRRRERDLEAQAAVLVDHELDRKDFLERLEVARHLTVRAGQKAVAFLGITNGNPHLNGCPQQPFLGKTRGPCVCPGPDLVAMAGGAPYGPVMLAYAEIHGLDKSLGIQAMDHSQVERGRPVAAPDSPPGEVDRRKDPRAIHPLPPVGFPWPGDQVPPTKGGDK